VEAAASLAFDSTEKKMTSLKLLSAGLIAAAMLTTPVLARHHHVRSTNVAEEAVPVPAGTRYSEASHCVAAPRVGAFATAPWENTAACEPVGTLAH
jgi:hypothetical protein